jgi:hypothetical protein
VVGAHPTVLPPPLPQAIVPEANAMSSISIWSAARILRCRGPIPNSSTHARIAPPLYRLIPCGALLAVHPACWLFVVVTVSVAVEVPGPATLTGEVDPKLNVGEPAAPDGPPAMLAVMVTLPVNPFIGVTVMREVLAEVAPALMVKAVALRVKLGAGAAVTITVFDPLAEL